MLQARFEEIPCSLNLVVSYISDYYTKASKNAIMSKTVVLNYRVDTVS
jgi:hypothetical protein